MIQEEVAATGIAGEPENELATFRRRRNSCCARGTVCTQWPFSSVVLLERRAALAERLERLLSTSDSRH